MQDTHLDIVVRNLVQRLHDGFGRTLHIGLDQHGEFHRAICRSREHVLEAGRCLRGAFQLFLLGTISGNFARATFILDHGQFVAGRWNARDTEHFHWCRRACFFDLLALVIDHGADLACLGAHHKHVTAFQRTTFDKNGCHRPPPDIELRFDHGSFGRTVGTRLQFEQLGLDMDLVHQFFQSDLLQSRNLGVQNITGHFLDDDFMLQQTGPNRGRIGTFLVDLVDRHDHRHASRLGMIDRLNRLRH